MLVCLDPGRRDTRILQDPVGKPPLSGERVVVGRKALPLMRQVVEPAVLHRFADLPLDERLAHLLTRRFGGIGTFRITLPGHARSVAQTCDRQAVAVRR